MQTLFHDLPYDLPQFQSALRQQHLELQPELHSLFAATIRGRDAATALPGTPYVLVKRREEPAIVLLRPRTSSSSSFISALLHRHRYSAPLVEWISALLDHTSALLHHRWTRALSHNHWIAALSRRRWDTALSHNRWTAALPPNRWLTALPYISTLLLALLLTYLLLPPTPTTTRTLEIYTNTHTPHLPPTTLLPLPALLALTQHLALAHAHLRLYGSTMTTAEIERRGGDILALESAVRQAGEKEQRGRRGRRVEREARTKVVVAVLGADMLSVGNGTGGVAEREMRRLMGGYLEEALWRLVEEE
ncbi:hypothetical protein Tdes44962_MAKER08092 [Teratosphaeria destructans]|uniref:Uncharacterized protein n=1 Tax=Teratosphaeria destructans TaxID=418781 RepID=A0A9W7SY21_9PEZI|nr:hypothetical protein Tdes44962_MAKER08092 [Teratosphaeria destructans]